MILIPILAFLLAVVLGHQALAPARGAEGQYLAVACIAGVDTVCGGIKSGLEGKFRSDVFLTGFFSNVLIAFGLSYLGDLIFLNLFNAVALVLGGRIFLNLSLIRRFLLTKWQDNRERKRQQSEIAVAQAEQANI